MVVSKALNIVRMDMQALHVRKCTPFFLLSSDKENSA